MKKVSRQQQLGLKEAGVATTAPVKMLILLCLQFNWARVGRPFNWRKDRLSSGADFEATASHVDNIKVRKVGGAFT